MPLTKHEIKCIRLDLERYKNIFALFLTIPSKVDIYIDFFMDILKPYMDEKLTEPKKGSKMGEE